MIDNIKIWLLLDSSNGGGIESHVFQLAEGLHNQHEQVEVVFLTDYGSHPMQDALIALGISNRALNGTLSALYTVLKKECPTVLHTHGYKAGIFGRLSAWALNIPSISTYHAGEIAKGKLAFYDWLDRSTACFANKIFAVSPQIAKRLPNNAEVTNNFVNTNNLQQSIGQQIAFVGRVSHEKGPDIFMKLAERSPDITFHLYGDGPQLNQLEATQPNNLVLCGQQNNMTEVWPNIGLLVMPSRFEGLPMAALEAMARGIPVLAFNVGALDKLIDSKVNGWLLEANDIDGLSAHIGLWNSLNEDQKLAFQQASRETIKRNFSSNIAIPKLMRSYQKLLR